MDLAFHWGCTLEEAKMRCSAKEFAQWRAYRNLGYWEPERADLRIGWMCMKLLAALSPPDTTVYLRDCMPPSERDDKAPPAPVQTLEQQKQIAKAFFAAVKARRERK